MAPFIAPPLSGSVFSKLFPTGFTMSGFGAKIGVAFIAHFFATCSAYACMLRFFRKHTMSTFGSRLALAAHSSTISDICQSERIIFDTGFADFFVTLCAAINFLCQRTVVVAVYTLIHGRLDVHLASKKITKQRESVCRFQQRMFFACCLSCILIDRTTRRSTFEPSLCPVGRNSYGSVHEKVKVIQPI